MNQLSPKHIALLVLVGAIALVACDHDNPGESDRTPLVRWGSDDQPTSGERGNMMITEINFAGSVTDDGTRDVDDIFIELQNKNPKPVNISGWHLIVEGDINQSWRIPAVEEPIAPNDYFVIARKKDGAFAEIAEQKGTFIEDLEIGPHRVLIELRDYDLRLMESAGSEHEEAFTGGWDTVSVRSMERAELIFGNRGEDARNWHAYSDEVGMKTIADGWRKYTLASPGEANSADYSGSSTSGNFE